MSILALRRYQVAPDYCISVVTVRDKKQRVSKLRIHRRRIRQTFRTILAQVSLPRYVTFKHKLR